MALDVPPSPSLTAWDGLDDGKFRDETQVLRELLGRPPLTAEGRAAVLAEAEALVRAARAQSSKQGVVESFLQEFSLGTREGLALMCLAEALLRTPDEGTRDRLIAEKIGSADWAAHLGQSDSLFVNASTWGLMLTGRLVDVGRAGAQATCPASSRGWPARLGEPVIRQAVARRRRASWASSSCSAAPSSRRCRGRRTEGLLCSFDMLGEGARTAADAERYEAAYAEAIATVGSGRPSGQTGPETGHGVSVKLSALSPRYEAVQEARVWAELYPRLKRLAADRGVADINFTIDAEEADRLALSLKLLDRLAREPRARRLARPRPGGSGLPEARARGDRARGRSAPARAAGG